MTSTTLARFQFTDYFTANSSVIDEVYFDADTSSLVVVLHSGAVLGYSNVLSSTFQAFASANSAGNFWNRYVKTNKQFGRFNVDQEPEGFTLREDNSQATSVTPLSLVNAADVQVAESSPVFSVTLLVQADSLVDAHNALAAGGYTVTGVTAL